jgi:hypothetical protein
MIASPQLLSYYLALTTHRPFEVPIYNDLANQRYNISVAFGTPQQTYSLLFDTGSTDVWVPKSNSSGCTPACPVNFSFDPTTSSTLVETDVPFDARYGLTPDLAAKGLYYNDTISIGDLPALKNATFAVGDIPKPLYTQGTRGIFGVGTRSSESWYQSPDSPYWQDYDKTYMPLWERLALKSPSAKRQFSVWLNAQDAKSGTVNFGGVDRSKYQGRLIGIPLNLNSGTEDPTGWNVNLTSLVRTSIDEKGKEKRTLLTKQEYSVDFTVDSGSPNMYVPTELYESIVEDLNATEIMNGAPYVPCSLRSAKSGYLDFGFNPGTGHQDAIIRVPYSDIIYPPGMPVTVPPVDDRYGEKLCYFGVVPNDGPVRLLGATFMRCAYVVFDAEEKELRMAQAIWSH